MSVSLRSIAIVGASLAGLRAAQELRSQGFDGRLTLIGAESQLPYDRPPLSKGFLLGKTTAEELVLADSGSIEALGADWHRGVRAESLDAAAGSVTLADGKELRVDGVVIATGGEPRHLPGSSGISGVHVLRSVSDAEGLRQHLADKPDHVTVVGAGFIGAEVASTSRELGLRVTVIEALDVPLGHVLGTDIGGACARLHRDSGVTLRTGTTVIRVITDQRTGTPRLVGIELSDGQTLTTDLMVVGIGMRPTIGWLAGSGLHLADGVVTDGGWMTRLPTVVAVGDVACRQHPTATSPRRDEHWTNAKDGPVAAVQNLLAGRTVTIDHKPAYFWSDQYGVRIQFAGRVSAGDEVDVVEGSPDDCNFVATYQRDGELTAVVGFNRPREFGILRRQLNGA
jgi:NADPH-dependent 2,4-dienoyl-CoA reductase/sulfur reductase-like enzyme